MTPVNRRHLLTAVAAAAAVASCAGPSGQKGPILGPSSVTSQNPAAVLPSTELAKRTLRYVEGIEPRPIYLHSVRTYLYGRFVGEGQDLQAGRDYDDELLFLGCMLHDVGLTADGDGDARFDLDGADLAARYLTDQGLATDDVQLVWDAIALHLSPDIAARKRPEIALVSAGAGFDLGAGPGALPAGYADRVQAVFPRLGAARALRDAIVDQALATPQKAPPFTLPGELVRQRTGQQWPTWEELTSAWGD
jgi:HD domain